MSFNKRFFPVGGIVASSEAACLTEDVNPFTGTSADGGVALYSLDYDGSDASGNYDGTPTNVEFGVGGQINYGARFNGSSSKIELPNTSLGITDASNFSISYWFNTNSTTQDNQSVIWANGSNAGARFGSGINSTSQGGDTSVYFGMPIDGTFTYINSGTSAFTANTWVHVVCVKSSTTGMTLYVDNVLKATNTGATGSGSATTTGKNSIGMYHTTSDTLFFNGSIDQLRIFNKALSSDEVEDLFEETACVYDCTTDTINYPSLTTPVAYYKLDNSAEDETGSYDGTETNIEYRFGRFGQAADFSGSTSANIDSNISTSLGNYYSISLWFNSEEATPSTWKQITGLDNDTYNYTAFIRVNTNGKIGFVGNDFTQDGSSTEALSTTLINANQWYHVVGVKDGTTTKIYINGVEEGTGTSSLATLWAGSLHFGKYFGTTNQSFVGKIDQVRIYSTVLDSDQVSQLYNEKPCEDTSNFKTVLYEGNSSTQYISNVGMDLETDGGLVWLKQRNSAQNHGLFDSVRGANNFIMSNSTSGENTRTTDTLSSFDANGFTLTPYSSDAFINYSGRTMVAWVWKGGGDAVAGGGTAANVQVSANTDAGFSIVTMDASSGVRTVGHGLSQAPELIIWKSLTSSTNYWQVLAQAANNGNGHLGRLALQRPDAFLTVSSVWNDTQPTDSVFTLGASCQEKGVAYCFHSVSGYSKIGSYSGSSSTVTVTTGFQPNFLIIKRTNQVRDWIMFDTVRSGGTSMDDYLVPNESYAENVNSSIVVNATSTGFTIASGLWEGVNESGGEYIYTVSYTHLTLPTIYSV